MEFIIEQGQLGLRVTGFPGRWVTKCDPVPSLFGDLRRRAVDTVVQRRNGARRLRDSDDDNDDDDDDESLHSYEARVVCNFVDV